MSKKSINDVTGLIVIALILIRYIGVKATIDLLHQILKFCNTFLLQLNNSSILSFVFKYYITFPIVGIILSFIGSPKGKEGYIIGKILYFIVGYAVCLILDVIAQLIF